MVHLEGDEILKISFIFFRFHFHFSSSFFFTLPTLSPQFLLHLHLTSRCLAALLPFSQNKENKKIFMNGKEKEKEKRKKN